MTTPHHVGQVAKAEILVTHLLDTTPAGVDHQRQAAVIVQQLQGELGWTPPRDLTETPALRPEHVADPDHRAACMDEIRSVFNRPRDTPHGH